MTQASFTISGSEFTPEFIERLRVFFNGSLSDFEFVIRAKPRPSAIEMRHQIDDAIEALENGRDDVRSFSGEGYDSLVKQLTQHENHPIRAESV